MTTENNELVCLTIFDDDTDRPLVRAMVEREVFAGYHKARHHDRYLAKKARARECSYDAKESQGISGAAYLDHLTARHAQEAPVEEGLYEALHEAMATLDERMQEALWALACGETTERALAEEWQLSKSTFHDRKVRALKLLRAELAARGYGKTDH